MPKKCLLMILDGFGIGKHDPFNAIFRAKMPVFDSLLKKYPHSQIATHGEAVGLPAGTMGNSEVGHMTIGSGRTLYQDLLRINRSISDKSFFQNKVFNQAIKDSNGRIHLMTLLSDGGVHSHINHLFAALELCESKGAADIYVHAFLDGRDTPPDSSHKYLSHLFSHGSFKSGKASLATVCGRYWAMDRDKRWDRIEKAYACLAGDSNPAPPGADSVLDYVSKSHDAGTMDEFIEPMRFENEGLIRDGDSVLFLNFRADRARELSEKILSREKFKPANYSSMTQYDSKLPISCAFHPEQPKRIFGEVLKELGLKQFRTAETEKYAHVTFFFNGGREKPFEGEKRTLIDSPKDVATYDLKPEMAARKVTDTVVQEISGGGHDFVLMNFANPDMIGHTGKMEPAIQAMEVIDTCIGRILGQADQSGFHTLITADHGNIEQMQDANGKPHTQHTTNPVPAVWVRPSSDASKKGLQDGKLADIIPTIAEIMQIQKSAEMDGSSLIK